MQILGNKEFTRISFEAIEPQEKKDATARATGEHWDSNIRQSFHNPLQYYCVSVVSTSVIKSFADVATRDFWNTGKSRRLPTTVQATAKRKLTYLNAAVKLEDLRIPPGNRLHALHGNRDGQHAIWINDQYRICFAWRDGDAYEVEITDYH